MGPLSFNPGMAKEFETPLVIKHRLKSGRWTQSEHAVFVDGLRKYGKDWKEISKLLSTRTSIQIRTHAQKYFLKYPEEAKRFNSNKAKRNNPRPGSPKRRLGSFDNGVKVETDGDNYRPCKSPKMKKTQSSPDVLRKTFKRKPFIGTQPWLDSDSEPEEVTAIVRSSLGNNVFGAERRKSTSALLLGKEACHRLGQDFDQVDYMKAFKESLVIDSTAPNFHAYDLDTTCIPDYVREDLNRFKLEEDLDLFSWC